MKPYMGRKGDMRYIEKRQNFEKKCREKLSDIAACKQPREFQVHERSKESKRRTRVYERL